MPRITWNELPAATRAAAAVHTGTVHTAHSVGNGINSGIATLLHTEYGPVFVKGVPADHPQVRTQQREAEINPHLPAGCPRLLWRVRTDEWDLLGFERLTGRTADFRPGSPDLPAVVDALDRLARIPCPTLPLKSVRQRWEPYTDPDALHLLDGEHLLHTDMAPHNIIVTEVDPDGPVAHLIDWAWPTRGAAWVDPAVWVLRLLVAGHTPPDADKWAARLPAWRAAPRAALLVFAHANLALWTELAEQDPDRNWKADLAGHARAWATYLGEQHPSWTVHERRRGRR